MLISKLTWRAYNLIGARPIRELDRFPSLNPAEKRSELAELLLSQVKYFGMRDDALPEWREAARIRDAAHLWKIWASLPILTKTTLRSRFEPVEMQRRFGFRGRVNSTGGSTGEPTRFFLDSNVLRASRGLHLYSRLRMGWKPGMTTIAVWGSDRDIGKQAKLLPRLASRLYGNHMIPGFGIDYDTVLRIVHLVKSKRPVAIYGFSSLLEYVAESIVSKGLSVEPGSVAVAWNGGEMLFDRQVQLFKKAFGVPILNRYGGRELSVTAFQESEGSPLRILRPWLFVEIVNDHGQPAAPGEIGRLLLTSTINRGTPFLRYEIGDLASYDLLDSDESGIGSLRALEGRNAGAIRLADGKIISSLYWNHLFKDYPEVRQFQVRCADNGKLTILLVGTGFSDERNQQLMKTLGLMWQHRTIHLVWTDDLPRTSQGKLMQVVQE